MRFVGDPRDGQKLERLEALQRRARHLGVHALLLLQRALPEGRRSARRDREARRRVDQGRHRPRHGREARELVRHAPRRRRAGCARPSSCRRRRASSRRSSRRSSRSDLARHGQGAAAVPAARREERRGVARAARPRHASRVATGFAGHRPGRARARPARARHGAARDARGDLRREGAFPQPFIPEAKSRRSVQRDSTADGYEARRLLQGLPRVAVGEGARLGDAGARAQGRPRAGRARVGHVLRRRRHPRGRARLLPPPERAHPRRTRRRRASTRCSRSATSARSTCARRTSCCIGDKELRARVNENLVAVGVPAYEKDVDVRHLLWEIAEGDGYEQAQGCRAQRPARA